MVTYSPWPKVKPAVRASMKANKSRNTRPEQQLGSLMASKRYKFLTHVSQLPGKPDFVFPTRKCVIFLHGCFWHQHSNCSRSHIPTSRTSYWGAKLLRNKRNDLWVRKKLRSAGWRVLIVWECQLKDPNKVLGKIQDFLRRRRSLPAARRMVRATPPAPGRRSRHRSATARCRRW